MSANMVVYGMVGMVVFFVGVLMWSSKGSH